jgi:DNA mismatch repair protein MutL
MRVSDDGTGILAAEAELAFARHATSKLTGFYDLAAIRTLGFRGEALPSIAAVADVELLTRALGQEMGTYLRLERGKVAVREARSAPQGTRVSVEWLFRRLPARRKFLRTVATELGHIADLVTRYAMAYPSIRFDLESEGRSLFSSPGSGALWDVIAAAYGLEVARQMLPVGGEEGRYMREGIEVRGYISPPSLHRSNRKGITLLLNGRWVQDRMLNYAMEAPYREGLPRGRHPIAVVEVRMDPGQVDVNVHPTKREVRFQRPTQVFGVVERAVRETLVETGDLQTRAPRIGERAPYPRFTREVVRWERARLGLEVQRTVETPSATPMELPRELPILRVLGQVASSYIVTEGPEGLYMFDQHTAHERVLYERFRAQRRAKETASQMLLEPVVLELSPAEAALLEERRAWLEELGFELEPFGGRMWRVRRVPAGMQGVDLQEAIPAALAEQGALPSSQMQEEEEFLKSLACHSAVKAGQALTVPEMQELVRALEGAEMPLTCPHGRPTAISFTAEELARHFGRR